LKTFQRGIFLKLARIFIFFSLIGPGLLTAIGNNDVGGIASNSAAGAYFGYSFLWVLLIITVALTVILDMCARMGVVTGKGLMDLIRESFGLKWTAFSVLCLLIANIATIISNFGGLAGGIEMFGISKYIFVPTVTLAIWYLVRKGTYKIVERGLIVISLVVLSYIVSAFMAKPDWGLVLHQTLIPSVQLNKGYLMLFIAFVGTTIAPWMLFFIQSMIVDKGLTKKHISFVRWEVWTSSFFSGYVLSFFIIIASAATLHKHGIKITDISDAAMALRPLAGEFAFILFAVGLLAAAILATFLLPLTTAYAVCEAFGFEDGLNKTPEEAPIFYRIFSGLIFAGAAFVLIPGIPLFPLIILAQVVAGLVSPVLLIFILLLVNNKALMGRHRNSRIFNVISIAAVAGIIAVVGAYLFLSVTGKV
jgi:Mn2+/Fe2+ NRAMP family transporter